MKILQGGRNSGRNTPVSASKIELTETILGNYTIQRPWRTLNLTHTRILLSDKVIALYPYKALNDDELSFDKDDIISVLGRDEPEWWRGELNGVTGLFPSNYVGPFVSSGKTKKWLNINQLYWKNIPEIWFKLLYLIPLYFRVLICIQFYIYFFIIYLLYLEEEQNIETKSLHILYVIVY